MPPEYLSEIEKAFKETLKQLYSKKTPNNKMLAAGGKLLAAQVKNSYGKTTTDWTTPDVEMLVQLSRNAWQFASAKNYQELKDLSLALKDEKGKLREWEQFKETAEKIGTKYNETWMRSEYDQCIAGAQNAARWVEFEQQADIMPNLQYQTVGDDSVRESHQVLDGIIRPMKDDFWNTHYPPNGWGCRCEAIQVPNGLSPVTPKENIPTSPVPQMFRTNLAKAGLIFPKNHPYYKGIPQPELRKAIAYLPPENTYINIPVSKSKIDVHPLHGEKELSKNLEAVNALLKIEQKAKIKLLPIIEEKDFEIKHKFYPKKYLEKFPTKNSDMLFDEKVAEIEIPIGSKTSIHNAIKHGKEQSDFVLVHISDDSNFDDAKRFANGQMKHYQNKEDLTIWLYNSKEKIEYKTQKR